MKYFTTVILIACVNLFSYGQSVPRENPKKGTSSSYIDGDLLKNGSGSLGITYSNTACGLNYVQTSLKTTLRYATPAGTGFPATINIVGIPNCATIVQSYLWWGGSGSASSGSDPSFTFNGSPLTGALIGTGPDKCWGYGGTVNYRYDVTLLVTGNGAYTFSSAMGDQIDGLTLMIIYTDPNATYQGSIQINDGDITDNNGNPSTQTMTGLNVCANSTYGEAFLITSDNQDNQAPGTHTSTLNGVPTSFPNLFYNFDLINTNFTAGQTTSAFGVAPASGDCYDWMLMGVYYQTTTCVVCTPPPGMTATSTLVDATCGNCDGTATVNAIGGVLPYTYSWNTVPIQTTQTATNLCAGTYIATVFDASGCLQVIDTVIINTTAGPPAPVITPAGPFCVTDAALNLTASTVGGTWSGTGITNTTVGTFNPTIAGVGSFQIIYTDAGLCPGSDTVTLIVNPTPTVTAPANGIYCNGDAVPVSAYTGTPVGVTYAWTNSNTAIGLAASGVGNTPAFTATNTTSSLIISTITVTPSANGCVGTPITYTITVNPTPTVIAPTNGIYCNGDAVLASSYVGTPVGVTYSWTNSNTLIGLAASGVGNTPSFTASNTTVAPITSTITVTPSANGCVGTPINYTITVNPTPTVTAPANGIYCNGDAVLVSAYTGTPVGVTYAWTNSNTAIGLAALGTGNTPAFTATNITTAPITGTITVTPSANGCIGTPINYTITVNPSLSALITPVGPFCPASSSINLTAVDIGGVWSGNGITNTVTGTFNPLIVGIGTHTITYGISGACGDTQTVNIVVLATMDATISPIGPFCESNSSVNLTAVDSGGVWSGNGITSTVIGTFDPTVAGPGTHLITYEISGQCGDTQSVSIVVIPDADATITPVGTICIADAAFNLTAVNSTGTWTGNGIINGVSGTFDPTIAGVGIHTITYTISGACGDVQTTNITVIAQDDATITPIGPFCVDAGAINLTAVTSGGIWIGNGITNGSLGTFNPTVAGAGTHTITYTTPGICGNTDTENIIVYPLPVVNFFVDIFSLCETPLQPFEFATDTTGGMFSTILWNFGDGNTGALDTISHQYISAGVYDVSLTLTDTNGCVGFNNKLSYVEVFQNPIADFTMNPNSTSMFDPVVDFFDQSSPQTIASWAWNIGGFDSNSLPNFTYTFPEDTGNYLIILTVVDANGCTDTTSNTIVVIGEYGIYVPNAFTPDGDGMNDGFFPSGFGIADEDYSFFIFDRWGELIYESHTKFEPWNGFYKNSLVQNGVYVWELIFTDINGKDHKVYGHVTIVK